MSHDKVFVPEEKETSYRKITVVIPNEMYQWLERYPGINRSEVFRVAVTQIQLQQAFEFDYKKFVLRCVCAFAFLMSMLFLLPTRMLGYLPMVFALTFSYILIDAVLVMSRTKEREKNVIERKRTQQREGADERTDSGNPSG